MKRKSDKGLSVVEVLVGSAIIAAFLFASVQAFSSAVRLNRQSLRTLQAGYLLEEGIEVVKQLRDVSWAGQIAVQDTGTPFYLERAGGAWQTTTTPEYVDGLFAREVVLDDVYRDANQDIAGSGTLDEGTRKVTVTVAWREGAATTTRAMSTYIADFLEN